MKIVICILLVVVFVYIGQLMMCFMYCRMKRKQDVARLAQDVSNDMYEKAGKQRTDGIMAKIKILLNGWMMYSVLQLGKVPCQKYRKFILKNIYQMQIEKNVVIYGNFKIRAPWNISIGKGTIIGDGCQLDGRNGLRIGNNVNMSTEVYIYTEQHDVNDPYFASGSSGGCVVIEDRAWLSSRTTVLPKVHVGKGAVLASGALATKDLKEYTLYGGVPAKPIGVRNHDLQYEFDGSFLPFY